MGVECGACVDVGRQCVVEGSDLNRVLEFGIPGFSSALHGMGTESVLQLFEILGCGRCCTFMIARSVVVHLELDSALQRSHTL